MIGWFRYQIIFDAISTYGKLLRIVLMIQHNSLKIAKINKSVKCSKQFNFSSWQEVESNSLWNCRFFERILRCTFKLRRRTKMDHERKRRLIPWCFLGGMHIGCQDSHRHHFYENVLCLRITLWNNVLTIGISYANKMVYKLFSSCSSLADHCIYSFMNSSQISSCSLSD